MRSEELKQIAIEASKLEYEMIMNEMKKAATQGSFTCKFDNISDGAVRQLKEAGFKVVERTEKKGGMVAFYKKYFEVQFAE